MSRFGIARDEAYEAGARAARDAQFYSLSGRAGAFANAAVMASECGHDALAARLADMAYSARDEMVAIAEANMAALTRAAEVVE